MLHHITRSSLQNSTKTISSIILKTTPIFGTNINQTTTTQERWKHSKRQIKKMQFKQSATIRNKILYKNNGLMDDIFNKDIPTRSFDAVYEPPNGFLPNGLVILHMFLWTDIN